jgi:hypothetical protein
MSHSLHWPNQQYTANTKKLLPRTGTRKEEDGFGFEERSSELRCEDHNAQMKNKKNGAAVNVINLIHKKKHNFHIILYSTPQHRP